LIDRAMRHDPSPRAFAPPPLSADSALFLDIDGTLVAVVDDPRLARVDADLVAALPRLRARLDGAVALVTGRAIADADRIFPGLSLPLAGQHGCERRDALATVHTPVQRSETILRLRERLATAVAACPGVRLEDKGLTLAMHYRSAPAFATEIARAAALALDEIDRDRIYVAERGNMRLELRPRACDKGCAIAEFMQEPPFAGRRPVFIGDDDTDEAGFAVVDALSGWSIKVGREASRAQYRLADISAVHAWLLALIASPADARASTAS